MAFIEIDLMDPDNESVFEDKELKPLLAENTQLPAVRKLLITIEGELVEE